MTITTESLISESQSQKVIYINSILTEAYKKTIKEVVNLNLHFSLLDNDIKKLLINNLILNICEFKKKINHNSIISIKREEYDPIFLKIIDEVVIKMELNKKEKSNNFFKNFKKYLKINGLIYINNVYLKRVSNKLALFR